MAAGTLQEEFMRTLVFVSCLLLAVFTATTPVLASQGPASTDTKAAVVQPVNLNTATAAQLEKLPGIGPKMAARIVEFRQKNGPFKKTEELMNVKGLGEKLFLRLKPNLTVTAPKAEQS
jgi:competence protein ComEA